MVRQQAEEEFHEAVTDPAVPVFEGHLLGKDEPKGSLTLISSRKAEVEAETELERIRREIRESRESLLRELRPEAKVSKTIAELAAEWLPKKAQGIASGAQLESRVNKYIVPYLGSHTSATLRKRDIEDMMASLVNDEEKSPQTANHVRTALMMLIKDAIDNEAWPAINPCAAAKRMDVEDKDRDPWSVQEVALLLSEIPLDLELQSLFAVAIYLGARRGEIFHLKKEHVDIQTKLLSFTGSHDRTVTKNKKRRTDVPIPDELVPYLERALAASPGPCVFVNVQGKQWTRDERTLNTTLRETIERVGLIKPCTTFHSLRGISSTLHQEAGCHPWVVSKVLGHSQKSLANFGNPTENMTARTYTNFAKEFERREVNKLSLLRAHSSDRIEHWPSKPMRTGDVESPRPSHLSTLPDRANYSGRRGAPVAERFWAKVDKTPSCWVWLGTKTAADGYGVFKVNRRKVSAHRMAWELEKGPLGRGLVISHKCLTPACVRPSHLLATSQIAGQKMPKAKGERNGRSKLTAMSVLEIRRLHGHGTKVTDLARVFGVSPKAIRLIVSGRLWKHLLEVLPQ